MSRKQRRIEISVLDDDECQNNEIPSFYNCDNCKKYRGYRFLDSYRFLPSSLDVLTSGLKTKCRVLNCDQCTVQQSCQNCQNKPAPQNTFKFTHEFMRNTYGEEYFYLALRKGVFCYDYVRDFSQLSETQLPNRSEFYNKLTEKECSLDDYNFAQEVFQKLQMRNLGAYSVFYLLTDVFLLR